MRIIDLEGTPRAMGEAYGETLRAEIREFYERRLANAIEQAKAHGGRILGEDVVLRISGECLALTAGWDPVGTEEMVATARAANIAPEKLWAMNGLTDLRDVLAWSDEVHGCSSFIAQGDLTSDGRPRAGQTWDLATDNMPYVIGVRRKPHDAPATYCLTTVGCLSLIGMNEDGLAIGTTNLRTTDARIGVCYLSLIHRALRARRFEDAVAVVVDAPRAGGHSYYLLDAKGAAAGIECAALEAHRTDVPRGFLVECNHVLAPALAPLEGDTPKASSLCRYDRMRALLGAAPPGSLDDAALMRFLSDHEGGEGAICRHDLGGISTNAAVVMTPSAPRLLLCHGHACTGEWFDLLAA